MTLGEYVISKSNGTTFDEKYFLAESGKVLGFDSNLNPQMLTNPVTGTASSGRVAFFNGISTLTGDGGLFWDNINKRLGIGTTTPTAAKFVVVQPTVTGGVAALFREETAAGGNSGYGLVIESEATYATSYALILRNLAGSTVYGGVSTATGQVGYWGIGASPTGTLGSRLTVNGGASIGNSYTAIAAPSNGMIIEGNIGIGTTAPGEPLHLATSTVNVGQIIQGSYDANANPKLSFRKSNGTIATPTAITSGHVTGQLQFYGYDGTSWESGADIYAKTTGTIADGRMPTDLIFRTAPDSVSGVVERMRILANGNIGIGIATAGTGVTGKVLELWGNSAATVPQMVITNDWAANSNGIFQARKSRSGGAVTTGDWLGQLEFRGHDGTGYVTGAYIAGVTEGTIATNQMPTSLQFFTENLTGTTAERMRISPNGNVNIANLTASKMVFTDASKNLTSTGIGTSSQFIKGDGSLDSTTYVTGTPWTSLGYITLSSLSSTATGLTYTNTTGVFSLTAGYAIPTTTSISAWDNITTFPGFGTSGTTACVGNDGRLSDARIPSAHALIDTTGHTASGLTAGHFLKATGATTYGFTAHGLSAGDVGAQASHANLTSLAGLSYVSGSFVKMTASGTFALDTSTYVTGTPWINGHALGEHSDVSISAYTAGHMLVWGGSYWTNSAPPTSFPGFGTTGSTSCVGNDDRLSDARTPTTHSHGNITNAGAIGSTASLPIITTTSGVLTVGSFGSTTGTFAAGDDSRLSNARTPSAHALIDSTGHSVSGLTSGHFLKATGATTYGFGAHGLTYSDVGACAAGDARLSDARTPLSHTHGNISNAGAIGSTATLPIITTTSGVLTAGSFGTTAGTFAAGDHTHSGYGTVTSITAGYGMVTGTITTSGTITLGTPDTITASSSNSVSANSHNHAITGFLALTGGTLTGAVTSNNSFTSTNFILSSDIRKKNPLGSYVPTYLDIDYQKYEYKGQEGQTRFGLYSYHLKDIAPELVTMDVDGFDQVSYIDLFIREIAYLKSEIKKLKSEVRSN